MNHLNPTNAKSFLFPKGIPETAKAVFVSDYPTYNEIKQGKQLAGEPMRIMQSSLMSARMAPNELYFTNVVKTVDKPLFHFWDKEAKFATGAAGPWIQTLKEELQACSSKFIVAAGEFALGVLADRNNVYNWRGSVVESTLVPGKWVIPMLHPNTIIPPAPNPLNQYLLTFDLVRLAKWVREGDYKPRPYKLEINPGYFNTIALLNQLLETKLYATDIEVFNHEVSCISFAPTPEFAFCIPFIAADGTNRWSETDELEIWKLIAAGLENQNIEKLGQNLTFDAHFLLRKYGITLRPIHDTMVAQQITMPDFKKGLDFITSIHTDLPYHKDEGKQWFKVGGKWETLWHYNSLDSLVCMIAKPSQDEDLVKQDNVATYERQRRIIEPLVYMQERGIRSDLNGIRREAAMLEKQIEKLQAELNELAGVELNPNSPKQLKDYFYGKHKQAVYKKKGKVTTDNLAMKRLKRNGFKEADLILKIRKCVKLISTYLEISKFDEDGRFRCSYNPVGTRYSRISSSENIFGTGGNNQNKPHSILYYSMADENYIGYAMDLSQAENRLVAYLGNITEMIEAFESGQDVHSLTASRIFGGTPEQIKAEDDAKILCLLGDGTHTKRFFGKKSNHGLNYDLGADGFSLQLEIPLKDGRFIHAKYHSGFPGVKNNFHRSIQTELRQGRTLTNLLGRKTRFLGPLDDATFKEAYSCKPQGTVGDLINEFGMNYIYYNQEMFEPVELLSQVHDEIVFQIPAPWHPEVPVPWEEHARMLQMIRENLEQTLHCSGHSFVIPVDTTMFQRMKTGVDLKSKQLQVSTSELAEKLAETWEKVMEKTRKAEEEHERVFAEAGV